MKNSWIEIFKVLIFIFYKKKQNKKKQGASLQMTSSRILHGGRLALG